MLAIAIVFLLFASYIYLSIVIGKGIAQICEYAGERYVLSNCSQNLQSLLDNPEEEFRKRNSAIWALGQIQDKEAVGVIEKYYTGKIPKKESLDDTLSQYEMKKALKLINAEPNISSWVWRFFVKL